MLRRNFAETTDRIGATNFYDMAMDFHNRQKQKELDVNELMNGYQKGVDMQRKNALADALQSGDEEAINKAAAAYNPEGQLDYIQRIKQAKEAEDRQFERQKELADYNNSLALDKQEKLYALKRDLEGIKANNNLADPKAAMDLRKEFRANNKDYYTVGDAYSKIRGVSENPSAAGDLSMIFNYMKMLDPASVVRESEFRNAENAKAWFDQNRVPNDIRLAYQKAVSGQMLLPEQRADFMNQAGNLFNAQKSRFDKESEIYQDIANRTGIAPDLVVHNPYDFSDKKMSEPQRIGRFNVRVGR